MKQMDRLENHTPSVIGLDRCRKSAVCIPLIPNGDSYDVLFQVRSAHIDSQPGDICLPGGMVEAGETTQDAALREMQEELLVSPKQIQLIGQMDILLTSRLAIYPYAVYLHDYADTYSQDEVAEVFRVPLDYFMQNNPEIYKIQMSVHPDDNFPYDRIYGGENYQWRQRQDDIYFYQYKQYTIWGITAKIMESFTSICKKEL